MLNYLVEKIPNPTSLKPKVAVSSKIRYRTSFLVLALCTKLFFAVLKLFDAKLIE